MPTEINGYSPSQETPLSSLVINEVDSTETFEKMKEKGILQDNQLYLVTDELSGGGVDIPASNTEPATGNYWLDTSAEGRPVLKYRPNESSSWQIVGIIADGYSKEETDALLVNKANTSSVYTKTEADTLLANKADASSVYTKTEADTLLQNKVNTADFQSHITSKSNPHGVTATQTGAYTKGETDTALQKKADKDRVVNPNLLDNWYFGNPVDQRGGYVVKPGTPYYKEMWTQSGTTSGYIKAKSINWDSNYGIIEIDGVEYYITEVATTCVRGYTGAGYGIDMWASNRASVLITDDGVTIIGDSNGICQKIDNYKALSGQLVTISILAKSRSGVLVGSLISGSFRHNFTSDGLLLSETITLPELTAPLECWMYMEGVGESTLKAAKLELGTEQTLAHQDADGNWQLNEIPDYGEQLRRCMRYFQVITNGTLVGSLYTSQAGRVYYKFPVTMRDNPSIINNPKGLTLWGHSPANGSHTINLQANPNVTVDGFDIDFGVNDAGTFGTSGWGVVINTIDINTNNNEPICWATAEL